MRKNNEQRTENKGERIIFYFDDFISFFIFCFVVFIVEISRRNMSLQSGNMLLYSVWVNRLVSFNRSNQYSVSAASFNDIVAFTRNSFLLTAYWASVRFAPIDVPERNNCLASVYSCFSSQRYLYKLYILIANLRLFSSAMFFILNSNIRKKTVVGKENIQIAKNKEQRAKI